MSKQRLFYEKIFIAGCILCNIAQIPVFMGNRMLSLGYMGCWGLAALWLFKDIGNVPQRIILAPIFFDLYCLIGYLFTGNYANTNLFMPINLSLFILLIGYWAGHYLNIESLSRISIAFIITAFFVALYLYASVFRGANWAGTSTYLYSSKNSAGQIFLVAIVLILFFMMERHRLLSSGLCLFFAALIFMMKSRATILTLCLAILYYVMFVIRKPYIKFLGIGMIVVAIVIVMTNASVYDLFINQIMLNNRDANNLSLVTSYRDIQYQQFFDNIGDVFLFGTGWSYIESFPLTALLNYGLFGAVPLFLFATFPIRTALKNLRYGQYRDFSVIVVILSIIMLINGIFEELSPFGPGVKCYFLWLVTGLMIGYQEECELYGYYEEQC